MMGLLNMKVAEEEKEEKRDRGFGVLSAEFISMCLMVNLERRASMSQLVNHPFLSQ